MSWGSCRVSMPGAMASMRAQNSPARLREIASMLAKSSDGCRFPQVVDEQAANGSATQRVSIH
jgi:hypothetical protein